MFSTRILLTVLLLACVAGRSNAAEDVYNPLAVGLRWVADVTMNTPDGQTIQGKFTREITGTEVIGGKTYFISTTSMEGFPDMKPYTTYRRKTPEGIYAIQAADPEKQEFLETPSPLTVGRKWEVPTALGKIPFKVEALEGVTVGTTRYEKCVRISYGAENSEYGGSFYLAPNIGNVSETVRSGGATIVISHKTFTQPK